MTRLRFKLKLIRFSPRARSVQHDRSVIQAEIHSKKSLNESMRDYKRDKRLWLSLTRDFDPGGALWVAVSGRHSWITYWPDFDSVDTHATNPERTDSDAYIEFLLDNTQPQMVHESSTFDRKTAFNALEHFALHGQPPGALDFREDLDTYC